MQTKPHRSLRRDWEVYVRNGLVYAGATLIILVVNLGSGLVWERLTDTNIPYRAYWLLLVLAVFSAMLYYPLALGLASVFRRILPSFRERTLEALKSFSGSLSEVQLGENLAARVVETLVENLYLSGGALVRCGAERDEVLYSVGFSGTDTASAINAWKSCAVKKEIMRLAGWMFLPLSWQTETVGVIILRARETRSLRRQEIEIIDSLASQAAVAIRNRELYEDLLRANALTTRAERLASLGVLTAGIAHEIRNGLHGLQGFADLLEEGTRDREDLNRLAKGIISDADRLSRMLNNFLLFARKPELNPEQVNLKEILTTSAGIVQRLPQAKGIAVEFEFAAGERIFWGDKDKLYQVFLNLLINAAEAAGTTRIRVQLKFLPHGAEVMIADNGEGIAVKDRERVFDPFFTSKPAGTGLGLSIVHQIVQEHGGYVDFADGAEGTSVTVHLPDRKENASEGGNRG